MTEGYGEIILYQPNEEIKLEVRLDDETVWLNRQQLSELFKNCFEFLQKVFLGLMYPFSCVLWAIFWSFPLLFFVELYISTLPARTTSKEIEPRTSGSFLPCTLCNLKEVRPAHSETSKSLDLAHSATSERLNYA